MIDTVYSHFANPEFFKLDPGGREILTASSMAQNEPTPKKDQYVLPW